MQQGEGRGERGGVRGRICLKVEAAELVGLEWGRALHLLKGGDDVFAQFDLVPCRFEWLVTAFLALNSLSESKFAV